MSRGRFAVLLGLLVAIVAAASFVIVLALISDDGAPGDAATTTTTTTPTSTTTTVPGGLVTPTFVAIVSSEGDESTAQQMRDELTEAGYDSGVLLSDDYTELEPGFWVAYVGPFPDVAAAEAAKDALVADGYTAAYTRCVGTTEECG
ncbi:MAG: SPOR domain-containing protein [Acidimicrobiales bacterium]